MQPKRNINIKLSILVIINIVLAILTLIFVLTGVFENKNIGLPIIIALISVFVLNILFFLLSFIMIRIKVKHNYDDSIHTV